MWVKTRASPWADESLPFGPPATNPSQGLAGPSDGRRWGRKQERRTDLCRTTRLNAPDFTTLI